MYKFVDTTERQEEQILPSEALNFNGVYFENVIPGYRTLYVSGREMIETEITDLDTEIMDGSRYRRKRYKPRTITVGYQLIAKSNAEFRNAYNKLNSLLDVAEAKLIFLDEPDKYYVGTKVNAGDVPHGRNAITAEIEFYCADPFKYSVEEYEVIPTADDGTTFVVDYKGTYKAHPVFEAQIRSDCGFISYITENQNILQIGDVEEVDEELKQTSVTAIDYNFADYKESDWILNDAVHVDSKNSWNQAGTLKKAKWVSLQNDQDVHDILGVADYGEGTGWHGPSITMKVPADASGNQPKNFCLQFSPCVVGIAQEYGDFEVVITGKDSSGKRINIAGIALWSLDAKPGVYYGFYIRGKERGPSINARLGSYGTLFSTYSIQKFGNKITFSGSHTGSKTYTDDSITDIRAVEISVIFAKFSSKMNFSRNGIEWIKFISHNADAWVDVPNKFTKGDTVTADCSSGKITCNGIAMPELGVLGNEWEQFYLKNGINQIKCIRSEWAENPDYKLKYREVFL
ncbi:phage tail family protein [Dorea longicatena]|uniref:distal tail protein Dit n=1 Tax=Dorea longicatena TaxID=88431 RepID=UPI00210BC574|nr:distal tail protein Dit [Dorea longicatena]MCQ4891680.1 phage tail family protein [Dorea longicatena]